MHPKLPNKPALRAAGLVLSGALLLPGSFVRADVASTVHNLLPAESGDVENSGPVGLCPVCHAPKGLGQTTALWSPKTPTTVYDLPGTATSEAAPGRPTGASRACLSCHDGTVALAVLPALGPDPNGALVLESDLSDDHPLSFVFAEAHAGPARELRAPATLEGPVKLDAAGQVQCTSCHDPHKDQFPDFLVMSNEKSALCVTCHELGHWQSSSHGSSDAVWSGRGDDPWPETGLKTVEANGCRSCHDPHAAAHPTRLLARASEQKLCLACHSGEVAPAVLQAQSEGGSVHPGLHVGSENLERPVSCGDCHDPHAGSVVPDATAADALCSQCHARKRLFEALPSLHAKHVEGAGAACAACHAPHRSESSTHLIHFMRVDAAGAEVARPLESGGRLEFVDLGESRGECYLSCHGVAHEPARYGEAHVGDGE